MIRGAIFWVSLLPCCIAATAVFARPEDVRGTPHDFSHMEQGDTCISCHSDPTDAMLQPVMQGSSSCQSCHDGATARNVHTSAATYREEIFHPAGVDYPVRNGYRPKGEAERRGIKIIGQTVECESCHDPHDNSKQHFLRMANTGSALCFACHDL